MVNYISVCRAMKKSSQVIDLNKQCLYSYMMSFTFLTFLPKSTGRTLYQPLLEERGERKFHSPGFPVDVQNTIHFNFNSLSLLYF